MSKAKRTELDRHLDRQRRCIDRINTVYYWQETLHKTHDQLLEALAEFRATDDYQKLPGYMRAYVQGFQECLHRRINRELLVWRLGPVDGPLPENTPESERWGDTGKLSALARTKGALYGGHFWKGTDKAFNGYECINADYPQQDLEPLLPKA